jgi:hypothetical protein
MSTIPSVDPAWGDARRRDGNAAPLGFLADGARPPGCCDQLIRRLLPPQARVRLTWEASNDVQHRLAGKLAIDKPSRDRADLAPWSFDRDLRPQLFGCDQIGKEGEADAGPLNTH